MEDRNKSNTYAVSFDYPSSYSSVLLRLRPLVYNMNFSSVVAGEYGIPRQLNGNSFTIATSLAASEIEDLTRFKCLDLPDIDFDLSTITADDYFRQSYKQSGRIRKTQEMALFSKILIFYVIGVDTSSVIIWFISHEKTYICLLSTLLVGTTWSMSLLVALLFSFFQELQLSGLAGYLETKHLSSKSDLRNGERSSCLTAPFIKAKFTLVDTSPGRE